jgi:hypothetical protein
MTPEQEQAIIDTIRTFRPGAPICVDDIRFAAAVDGHDLSGVLPWEWGRVMRSLCSSKNGPCGAHDRRSWMARGHSKEVERWLVLLPRGSQPSTR